MSRYLRYASISSALPWIADDISSNGVDRHRIISALLSCMMSQTENPDVVSVEDDELVLDGTCFVKV